MTYGKSEENEPKRNHDPIDDSSKGSGFAERLNLLVGSESGRSFARKVGIPYSTFYKYQQGTTQPTLDNLIMLSAAMGVSIEWLALGSGDKEKQKESSSFLDDFALIPGYDVQVSTGNGTIALDERQPSRHLAFRRKWLSYRGFNEKDLVLLWAKGDSMEPTISNNDTLVVNTSLTKPIDGNIYVIRHEDNLWAKRLQVQPGAWLLISDNQAVYPPIEIKREDMANFEVIGQVVHISKDVGV
ncbi:helix-turn-helix domain-containing protein [Pectobacterium versatile]|uniref:LexA family transcriptional regulator n=1 Tax=Pectobacterium versatile TaxID=2488639 RepID=UPI001B3A4C2F|nr:XRE family transcriptional regulator [Pectobacterium versatile]MBQ4781984.1 helix-turn-helix domain-containing protein [Pectobacterium versatile]MBQ4786444.1 helix-turn-helix domain-containing protein [Pectobacterium versatile]